MTLTIRSCLINGANAVTENSHVTEFEVDELGLCISNERYFIESYFKTVNPFDGLSTITLERQQLTTLDRIRGKGCVFERNEQRQIGTTTVLVAHALYLAIFNSNERIILMGKDDKHASDMRSIFKTAYNELPDFLRHKPKIDNKYTFELPFTKAWVHFINSDPINLRGFNTSLLVMDDFETYKPSRQEELRTIVEWHCISTADLLHV